MVACLIVTSAAGLGASATARGADTNASAMVRATVYSSSNASQVFDISPADMTANGCPTAPATTYTEYNGQGDATGVQVGGSNSWSLYSILSCGSGDQAIGVTPTFTSLYVDQPNGDVEVPETGEYSVLTPAAIEPGSGYFEDDETPVVEDVGDGNGFRYDRPAVNAGDPDYLDEVSDAPINVSIYSGQSLSVSISVSSSQISAGDSVTFTPSLTGSQYSYSWDFTDGTPASSTAESPQVTFPDSGSWRATLLVTDADGDAGSSSTEITVGTNSATTSGPTTTGAFTTTTPTTSTTATTPLPVHRTRPATKPTATRTTTTTTQAAAAPTTRTTASTTSTTTTTTATTATTAAPPLTTITTTTRTTSTPVAAAGPASPPGGGHSGAGATAPTRTTPPHPAPTPQGQLVSGRLVAAITPLSANASPLVHLVSAAAGSDPPAVADRSPGTSPWGVIGGVLALLVLLALGAGRELRGRINWRSLRPPAAH